MEEIRLNVGYLWQNITNIESDIQHINWNMENHKDKKIVVNLPISYFDEKLFDRIDNLDAIEFESKDGRRFKPRDIILTNNRFNNMINSLNNDGLSQFEKFIVIYSFVKKYKQYRLSENNEKYFDIGRSPYLFLDDDYMNCAGYCEFLCILCRKAGINITMFADEINEHAICYLYLKDDNYGIDGYFSTDPTNNAESKEIIASDYSKIIGHITINNDFEKFLNSSRELSYSKDTIDISLFSKYILFLKTHNFLINSVENIIDLLYCFRDEFKSKKNYIAYDTIYNAILKVSDSGYILGSNIDKEILRDILFLEDLKGKTSIGENTDDLVKSFIKSSGENRK